MCHLSKSAAVLLLSLMLVAEAQGQNYFNNFHGGCGGNCPTFGYNCVNGRGSQTEKTVQPGSSFHALEAASCLNVEVQQGGDGVRFEADQAFLPYLEAVVEDGTLKVKIKQRNFLLCPRNGCNIKVFINAQNLDKIQVLGNTKAVTLSDFASSDNFLAEVLGDGDLTLSAQAPNNIRLKVAGGGKLASLISSNTNSIQALVQGGGKVTIAGAGTSNAQSAAYHIMGSGEIDARMFSAQTTTTEIFGAGEIWVGVSSRLDARILGSGTVRYFGSPSVTKHIMGSGQVIRQI